MSDSILKKLVGKIGLANTAESKESIDTAVDKRLNVVLDEHLANIAAAHYSTHGDHHTSQIQ
jgi:hypothetical protein